MGREIVVRERHVISLDEASDRFDGEAVFERIGVVEVVGGALIRGQVGEVAIEDVEGNDAGIAEGAGECVCEGGLAGAGAAGDGD